MRTVGRHEAGASTLRVVSMFDMGDSEGLDVGIVGDGPNDFIVTGPSGATHRRYRNRVTGETIIDRIRTL
ncbi:MAG: hypothetical protein JWM34_3632 [Ilumatobacteraceae bacterium]|nr:hypothetical protein [Ilumatobacteraceae bacterium]